MFARARRRAGEGRAPARSYAAAAWRSLQLRPQSQKNADWSPDWMKPLPQAIRYFYDNLPPLSQGWVVHAWTLKWLNQKRLSVAHPLVIRSSFKFVFFYTKMFVRGDSAGRLVLFVMLRSSTWHHLIQLKTITLDLDILFSLFLFELLTSTLGSVWKRESRALS